MKFMGKFLLLYGAVLLFASCGTWQYVTVNSSTVSKNEKLEFVIENDSMQLVYNFHGANAPVNITVHNKLNVPMYIDWQRSAIIVNEKANSYVPDKVQIEGAFNGTTSTYNVPAYRSKTYPYNSGYASTSGSIYARADVPEQIAFVPPQTYVTKTPTGVTSQYIHVSDTAYHKIKYKLVEGTTVPAKKATFTESTSPLKFKSYLTLIIGETGKPVVYEHSFYISELLTTTQGIWQANVYRGNQFYVTDYSSTATYNAPASGKPNVSGSSQ